MEDENTDGSEVLETTETTADTAEADEAAKDASEEQIDIEELKKKAAERDEFEKKNKQLYERLKKAPKAENILTPQDVLALSAAQLHPDDLEEVQNWSSYKKLPIRDALADSTLKTILAARVEERRTSAAMQTKSGRGSTQVSGEQLLTKARSTGEVPDDDDQLNAMVAARMEAKRNKKR